MRIVRGQVKLGYLAGMHGQLAAKNIQACIDGKPMKAWKPNGGFEVPLCRSRTCVSVAGSCRVCVHHPHRSNVLTSCHSAEARHDEAFFGTQVMLVTLGPNAGYGNIGRVTVTGMLSWMPAKVMVMLTGFTVSDRFHSRELMPQSTC